MKVLIINMSKNKFAGYCCILIMMCGSLQAAAQDETGTAITLKECVETALKNNLQVYQAVYQSEAAGVNYKQAKNNLLPDLFGNLGHGINSGRNIDPFTNSYINQQITYANAGINSSVVLYNGGLLSNTVKQNNLINQAATMEAQQTRESITLNVLLAYLQILTNQDLLTQANNQVTVTRQQVARLKILNDAGSIIPAQYYDLKGQLSNDELAIVNNQNALNQSKFTLAQLMNVPYNAGLTVAPINDQLSPDYPVDASSVITTAMQQLSIIKGVTLRRQAAEKGIQVAKGNFYPIVRFSAGLNTNYSNAAKTETVINTIDQPNGDFVNINGSKEPVITQQRITALQSIGYFNQFQNNYGTSVFLNVSIPIFNGFRAKNRVTMAKIEEKNAVLVEQTTKTQLSQSIEQASFNLAAAADRYKTLQQQVADFSESFRTVEVRFNAGAITQVDYLISTNNLDRANINLIVAKYDYTFRAKILDYYMGKLNL